MGWPTASEIGIETRIALTEAPISTWKTSYGYDVTAMLVQVIADIAAYCRRPLGFDQQTLTQVYDGGSYMLMASNPPIISVTSVTDNETEEVLDPDDDDYWVYDRYVRLPRPTDVVRIQLKDRTPQLYTVVYVGGYDDDATPLPADVKEVCAEIASRTLLRVDQQYRVYQNVDQFQDGEIRSVFPDKEKAFADQYAKLARNGRVMTVIR